MIGAVDIGGTNIVVGIVDGDGRVLHRTEAPTNASGRYAQARDQIAGMLHESSLAAGVGISGIGIGCTGPVCPISGEIGDVNFFPHWRGCNPVADLAQIFRVRVAMENDADAAALGEAEWGEGKGKQRLLYVSIGTGIGIGFVLHHQLYRGVDHSHPEMGHHLLDPSGPPCTCGFRGCWESLAAGPAMVGWLEANAPPDYPHRADLNAKRICELAMQGDAFAQRTVEREAHYLGLGLANLVTLFAPDAIVLGGGVMKSHPLFLPKIRQTIRNCCRYVPFEKTEISLASLGENANLIGAARVWHHRVAHERELIDF
jgi:glucokinase